MKVLLDTNILIHREAAKVVNPDIGTLFYWLDKLGYEKCIHPCTIEEIKTHRNADVVSTMLVKIKHYNQLNTVAPDSLGISQIRDEYDSSDNDRIDTSLLNEVHQERIDLLITEDRGIHRKALLLGIDDKVFSIDSFLEKVIFENPGLKDYNILAVKKEYFGNINIADPFFDSFKRDYSEFEKWFTKKSEEQAYICLIDDQVKAFLYLKIEDATEKYDDISPTLPAKKRLKIGTLKVVSTGLKLGERFLKIILDNALAHGVEEIYVTIFRKRPEQVRLINLLQDWGFTNWGIKRSLNGNEQVWVKSLAQNVNIAEPKLSYPFVSLKTKKFIVPIYPAYHTDLLPDSMLNNESPDDFVENEPHRNAIQKVYISRSFQRNLAPGDLIAFYRTKHQGPAWYTSVISTIGVVESMIDGITTEDDFIRLCRKRSVFSDDELRKHWQYKYANGKWEAPFIVNFLYVTTLPMPRLTLQKLTELRVIQEAPRGFELLEDSKFELLLKEGRADASYFVN